MLYKKNYRCRCKIGYFLIGNEIGKQIIILQGKNQTNKSNTIKLIEIF